MPLEALHENAIDLLVIGKKQVEVAKELNVSTRTVRRWADNSDFVAELEKQHSLSRKLELDDAAESAREMRELRKLGRNRIRAILEDPKTSEYLVVQTLKLLQQEERLERRAKEAQAWRERIHIEKKRERLGLQAPDLDLGPDLEPKSEVPAALDPELQELRARRKADKTGHFRPPHAPAVPHVKPVPPFRYAPAKK